MVCYKRKETNTIESVTYQEGALQVNYPMMMKDSKIEILNVYKKMNDKEVLSTILA
jgi:hypothetical protein